jgi:exosortase/archaeosortase family protein
VSRVVACTALACSLELVEAGYQTACASRSSFLAVPLLIARTSASARQWPLAPIDVVLATLCVVASLRSYRRPGLWSVLLGAPRYRAPTLFVTAAVVLVFGAGVSFGSLTTLVLMALPAAIVRRTLGAFTTATTWVATQAAVPLGLAEADPSTAGLFAVEHGGDRFTVLIGSACSGVNTLVGFLVVGIFALYFVKGPAARRILWLVAGAALVWLFNVLRILGILAVAGRYGEEAAFRVLHPVAGLVALNAAVLVLLLLMRPFGLRWRRGSVEVDSPLATPAEPCQRATGRRVLGRLALLAAATAAVALANGTLRDTARGLSNDGRPAVAPFTVNPAVGPDWTSQRLETIAGRPNAAAGTRRCALQARPATADRGSSPSGSMPFGRTPAPGRTLAYDYNFNVELAQRVDLGSGVWRAFVYEARADN